MNCPVLGETYIQQYEIDKKGKDIPLWYTGRIMRPGFLPAVR